jgi:integration host factor subunit alpha
MQQAEIVGFKSNSNARGLRPVTRISLTEGEFTMTKADIVDKIHANTGLTRDGAFAYLETVLETIKKTLETSETVKITGFGSFIVKKKNSRNARNPQTGEPITIAARKILTFKASTVLKSAMNQASP